MTDAAENLKNSSPYDEMRNAARPAASTTAMPRSATRSRHRLRTRRMTSNRSFRPPDDDDQELLSMVGLTLGGMASS